MSLEKPAAQPLYQTHRYTRDEYHRMGEAGIFGDRARVELIEGEIIDLAPIDHQHRRAVNVLSEILVLALHGRAIVSPQNPVVLGDLTEPQPDLVVFRYRADHYLNREVTARDALLVIEAAASSLRYDQQVKLPLYARHEIPEVWIVDLESERITLYRQPGPNGYADAEEVPDLSRVEVSAIGRIIDLRLLFAAP